MQQLACSPITFTIAILASVVSAILAQYKLEDSPNLKTLILIFGFVVVGVCAYAWAHVRSQTSADLLHEKTKIENENLKRNLVQVYEAVAASKKSASDRGPPPPEIPTGMKVTEQKVEDEEAKPYM